MKSMQVADHSVGVFVADSRHHELEYRIGAGCRVAIILPQTRPDTRTVTVRMTEPESKVYILAFIVLAGAGQSELRTLQHHQAPDTSSDLIVKSVLSDSSKFTYRGSILVDRIAQKTDAYQRNENLLLSRDAEATSSPALEIMANDVRCTHGATIATLDPDEVWYLGTRGIGEQAAADLIVDGFMQSAFDRIGDESLRLKSREACAALSLGAISL